MPDSGRFPDRDIERDLRDLGARIEYPPTPDVAQAVRRQIDEEDADRQARRLWPAFLSPRWSAVAAAFVLVFVAALSPTVRTTLSDLFVSGGASSSGEAASSGHQAEDGSEAGGSAGRPQSGGREEAGSSVASGARPSSAKGTSVSPGMPMSADEATGCPSPSLEAEPARAAPEAKFRLRGAGFSSGCDKIRPTRDIRIGFRQDGKTWKLATVDADRDLTFEARLRVPAGARSGQATVRATTRSGELAKIRFIVLR